MPTRLGEIKTKDELVAHLVTLRMSAIYDIFAQTCLHEFLKEVHNGTANPARLKTKLPEGTITLKQFIGELENINSQALVETKRWANRHLTMNYIKVVFRLTYEFCRDTSQLRILQKQSWYEFARTIVNSLSHDFLIRYDRHSKRVLPLEYGNVSLDKSMDGQPLSCPLGVLVSLSDDVLKFARKELK